MRIGPSTVPAIAAPMNAPAATAVTAINSAALLRHVSCGLDSSSSTANQAIPGTATR